MGHSMKNPTLGSEGAVRDSVLVTRKLVDISAQWPIK